jgi:membrane associated rhomboid family serine protease
MQIGFPPPGPQTKRLLILLLAIFVLLVSSELIWPASGAPHWLGWLALNVPQVLAGRVWTLVTWCFVHSTLDWGHLVFNSIALYFFGSALEREIGGRRMLQVFAAGGAVATLFVVVASLFRMALGAEPHTVVGASGAIAALTAGWCVKNRRATVYFFFFPMPAIAVLGLLVVLDVVRSMQGPLSLAAHLGGYTWGVLWALDHTPRRLWLRFKLWNVRRKLRVLRNLN